MVIARSECGTEYRAVFGCGRLYSGTVNRIPHRNAGFVSVGIIFGSENYSEFRVLVLKAEYLS